MCTIRLVVRSVGCYVKLNRSEHLVANSVRHYSIGILVACIHSLNGICVRALCERSPIVVGERAWLLLLGHKLPYTLVANLGRLHAVYVVAYAALDGL